uniref:HIRA n=1 Tax=Arundo donax TaxID=35708 RepID=A0A0A9FJN0_ARUDO
MEVPFLTADCFPEASSSSNCAGLSARFDCRPLTSPYLFLFNSSSSESLNLYPSSFASKWKLATDPSKEQAKSE